MAGFKLHSVIKVKFVVTPYVYNATPLVVRQDYEAHLPVADFVFSVCCKNEACDLATGVNLHARTHKPAHRYRLEPYMHGRRGWSS